MNNEWLPIEQAPKDRPIVAKTSYGGIYAVEWYPAFVSGWILYDTDNYFDTYKVISGITHYMELPE